MTKRLHSQTVRLQLMAAMNELDLSRELKDHTIWLQAQPLVHLQRQTEQEAEKLFEEVLISLHLRPILLPQAMDMGRK
jgi:hypothetical protein